jgi:hypothetical protein
VAGNAASDGMEEHLPLAKARFARVLLAAAAL